ncbi:uncharacterized protein LOC128183490 isoform X1 [Crassostrea angulata]|uniref:uncharacterized protein LOC128183490 isoform X1 n=1 Tax=Magallana angulata TaxID=2784310 RepID=UPI0005C3BE35|nr:uncharacterized protein LOC105347745 isoform X10 [Crassostrea gigas]XP_052708463.1 uncharacterized protein LOC128183490 isoform X1 [Crassostrea angulata]|eukprot:XP_011455231.1 PREDICTED: uncharacterized protein LOC105347745 isoform X10 [Crassostrea gigas]
MAVEPSTKKQVTITTPDIEREIRDESSDKGKLKRIRKDETIKEDRGSEIPTTSQSQRVDISRIQSAYSDRCHSRSNFPLVLDEYGEEKDPRDKENKKKKSSKKATKSETHDDEVQEKRRKKQEELESRTAHERYMQVMDDLNNRPVGDRFYSKKVATIATSVDKFQDRNYNSPPKSPRVEIMEVAKANKKAHKKKEKYVLTTNNEHMKNITKTETAKIIEIQDRLIREGKLKSQGDIDKFREDAKDPVVLNSYLSKSSTKQDLSFTNMNEVKPERSNPYMSMSELPPRSLSYISERSSRPETRHDWAITQQFKHKHEQNKTMTPHQIAKQAAHDLEKRFPKTQMPPMKSFTIDLGEKPPDPEELQREIDLKVRIKQRKKFLRKLNRMYQLSMAHNAATSRILEKHGEINKILEGNSLRDVVDEEYACLMSGSFLPMVATLPAPEDVYITEEDIRVPDPGEIFGPLVESVPVSRASTRTNLISQKGSRENLASQKGSRETLLSRGSSKAGSKVVRRQTFSVGDIQEDKVLTLPPAPLPLTMDEIRTKAKIVEAKCLSSNWINYMRAGKPTA